MHSAVWRIAVVVVGVITLGLFIQSWSEPARLSADPYPGPSVIYVPYVTQQEQAATPIVVQLTATNTPVPTATQVKVAPTNTPTNTPTSIPTVTPVATATNTPGVNCDPVQDTGWFDLNPGMHATQAVPMYAGDVVSGIVYVRGFESETWGLGFAILDAGGYYVFGPYVSTMSGSFSYQAPGTGWYYLYEKTLKQFFPAGSVDVIWQVCW